MLFFEDGAFATLTYSGYGRFDTDEFQGWMGELGGDRSLRRYGQARAGLGAVRSPDEEAALKSARAYGGRSGGDPDPVAHNHFGLVLVSCDHADLRPMPDRVLVYGDDAITDVPLRPPVVPRAEVIDELYGAVVHGRPPLHSGEWGLATTEVVLAILQSARDGREVPLS